jgi:type I restriction enzyme S subunit
VNAVVEQTDQVSDSWPIVPLASTCCFKPPKSIPRKALDHDALVSFVPMNDLGELRKHFEAKQTRPFADVVKGYTYFADGDVLCAKITPCFENGKLGIARNLKNDVGFGSSEFVVMRPGEKLLAEFLYYYLARDTFRESGKQVMSGAVGHKRVPKEHFEGLHIPLPPLDEQKRIVAVLDQAFAALDRVRAHAEANLADAGALVSAVLNTTYGGVAGNCSHKPVKAITDVFTDGDWIEKKDQASSGIRLIQTGNVGPGYFKSRPEKARFIDEATFDRLKCYEVASGDVLISRLPDPVGRACIIPVLGSKMITAVDCSILRFKVDAINPAFFVYYTQTAEYLRAVDARCTGTTRKRISRKNLGAIYVPIPSLTRQKHIVQKLDELSTKCGDIRRNYATDLRSIATLRQSLLQKAFAGELT